MSGLFGRGRLGIVAVVLLPALVACGRTQPPEDAGLLPQILQPFCSHISELAGYLQTLEKDDDWSFADMRMKKVGRLADDFAADSDVFESSVDPEMRDNARAGSNTLRTFEQDLRTVGGGGHVPRLAEHYAALGAWATQAWLPFCGVEHDFRWVGLPDGGVEIQAPNDWARGSSHWKVDGLGDLAPSLIVSPDPQRWFNEFPDTVLGGIEISRSVGLADRLRLGDRRTRDVLDTLRGFLASHLDHSRQCEHAVVYRANASGLTGFKQVSTGCGMHRTVVVDILMWGYFAETGPVVVFLRATGYAPRDLATIDQVELTIRVVGR